MEFEFILTIASIIFLSSIIHGSIGFGFGMVSTPVIALFNDIQTTIIFMLLPTMTANVLSIVSEGNFFEALKKFWFIISLIIIGSIIGTYLLIYTNSELFKLLLAFIMFFYLIQSLFNIKAAFIHKYPKTSTYGLGIFGGIISGLTNIVAPLMIIYTLELNYTKKDTIQLSNLCFFFSKLSQLIVFLYFSKITIQTLEISTVGIITTILGIYFGVKIKRKIDQKVYIKILKILLFILALTLVFTTI